MDIGESLKVLTKHPKWGMNIMFLGVCFVIPLIGPIVAIGYCLRCFQAWTRDEIYPEFEFDYFMDYLKNGLWPFLCSLVVMVVVVPFAFILMMVPFISFIGDMDRGEISPGTVLLFLVAMAGIVVIEIIVMILLVPITLKSGIEQNFKAGFSLKFVMDFFRRVGGRLLLVEVIFFFLAFVGMTIGYLAFVVGAYLAMAWLTFAKWHAYEQLYRLYVRRGGIELEFSEALSSVPANKMPPPFPPASHQPPPEKDAPPPEKDAPPPAK